MTTGISSVVEITEAVSEALKHLLSPKALKHEKLFLCLLLCLIVILFAGVPETLVLNMSKLVVSVLATVKGRDPLASEVIFCLLSFFQEI